MKTLKLTMEIKKLEGFDEQKFISILRKDLSEVYVKELRYGVLQNGYRFEVDFEPVLASAGISYQPILGCFSSIGQEYDKVELIGIPSGEMELV
ncbi:MAG: hypothetical protein J6N15_03430 [Ruminiclostridium sp.]|nr:hypothetical protein [Ruminiclostridium sp.]